MPRSRTAATVADTRAKLDRLTTAARREAEGAEADPFDDAMAAAVTGAAEAMKAEAGALAELDAKLRKLAGRALVAE